MSPDIVRFPHGRGHRALGIAGHNVNAAQRQQRDDDGNYAVSYGNSDILQGLGLYGLYP